MPTLRVIFPKYVTRTIQETSTLAGSALSQFVIRDSVDELAYVVKLVDGQLRVVGQSNGEALAHLVMLDGETPYVIELVNGQLVVTGTA